MSICQRVNKNHGYLRINDAPGGSCAEAPAEANLVVRSRAKAPAEGTLVRIVGVWLKVSVCLGKRMLASKTVSGRNPVA